MSDFTFAHPEWIHALWGVLAFVLALFWFEQRGTGALARFLSPLMQGRLVARVSPARRVLRSCLLGIAGIALVVALMRPQWGFTYEATPRAGAEFMVCLDVSKSMLAEDAAPNRLERAKAEVEDLLRYLDGDHVGLVAYAGNATVLCPLTPDFGFLRMVLKSAHTGSVRRGGTRLSEPIRKALACFGDTGDVAHVILLITDGEDHDSYPMAAAEEAAKRGVRIVSIGIGSEAGSEIHYTDPRSGARTQIRDSGGAPVVSRLDGATLRDMAAKTDGAYIPAGTGLVDWESIYRERLMPLMRGQLDGRGRAVKKEGFQWAVLAGMFALVAATAMTGGTSRARAAAAPRVRRAPAANTAASLLFLCVFFGTFSSLTAQAAPQDPTTIVPEQEAPAEAAPLAPQLPPPPSDPLAAYNDALAPLTAGEFERAEQLLNAAHANAGADNRIRFRACYNLGWLFHRRAAALFETEPPEALQYLRTSANWFREAVRLYPKEADPRHNLEAVLKKALALEDSLAKRDDSLATRLDAVIAAEREAATEIGALADRALEATPHAGAVSAEEYRGLATGQRMLIGDAGSLVDAAVAEQETLAAKSDDQRTTEEKLRAAQLVGLLEHMHRAQERLGQCRSQLRKKIPERAYRRATAAVAALKRARDQLRNPLELLSAIIPDAEAVLTQTATLAAAGGDATSAKPAPPAPIWLTAEYLREEMEEIWQRSDALHRMLEAGVAEKEQAAATADAEDPAAGSGAQPANPPANPDEERLVALVKEALPHLKRGVQAFDRARGALDRAAAGEAMGAEEEGVTALIDARELFLDLRGLIEAVYIGESQQQQVLSSRQEQLPAALADILPVLAATNAKDATRCARIEKLIDEETAKLAAQVEASGGAAGDPAIDPQAAAESAKLEHQRYDLARVLLGRARAALGEAAQSYERCRGLDREEMQGQVQGVATAVQEVVKNVEDLRRLFFTLVEHLRDTARRQIELVDETAQAAGMAEENERNGKVGPLVPREQELARYTGEIAAALEKHAEQPAAAPPGVAEGDAKKALSAAMEMQRKLTRAAELVHAAQSEMGEVVSHLQAAPPVFDQAQSHGQNAAQQMIEALALLEPPKTEQKQNPEPQQEQEQKNESQADPAQQLQSVRDQEAKRRAERDRNKSTPYDPVEKDW